MFLLQITVLLEHPKNINLHYTGQNFYQLSVSSLHKPFCICFSLSPESEINVYEVFNELNLITPRDHGCFLHTTLLQFYSSHDLELIGYLLRNFFKSRYKAFDLKKKFKKYFEPSYSLRFNNYSDKYSSLSIDYNDANEFRMISKALLLSLIHI